MLLNPSCCQINSYVKCNIRFVFICILKLSVITDVGAAGYVFFDASNAHMLLCVQACAADELCSCGRCPAHVEKEVKAFFCEDDLQRH